MSCVPCPCNFLKITSPVECSAITAAFRDPPRLGQIYAGAYSTITYVPEIVEGIPEMVQDDLTSWIFRLGLGIIFPWLIMFIVLFIIMGGRGLIMYDTAIMLIVLVIVLTIIAMSFVYFDTRSVVTNLGTQIQEKLSSNWNEKKDVIVNEILESYLNCSYCHSSTIGCGSSCGGLCSACGNIPLESHQRASLTFSSFGCSSATTVTHEIQTIEEILNSI